MTHEHEKAATYRQLATAASLKATKLSMLKEKIESEHRMMLALSKYYDEQANLQFDNEMFGFNLNTLN